MKALGFSVKDFGMVVTVLLKFRVWSLRPSGFSSFKACYRA